MHLTNIPQSIILKQKYAQMCTFLLQNFASLDIGLVHFGMYGTGLLRCRVPVIATDWIRGSNIIKAEDTSVGIDHIDIGNLERKQNDIYLSDDVFKIHFLEWKLSYFDTRKLVPMWPVWLWARRTWSVIFTVTHMNRSVHIMHLLSF